MKNIKINKKNVKSQSEVVSTVLLILIVVIAIVGISAFVMSIVNRPKTDCFELSGKYEIRNNAQYTCWNSAGNYLLVQLHLGDVNESIKGLQVVVSSQGESKSYDITRFAFDNTSQIKLYNQLNGTIELPSRNGEKTYNLSGLSSKPEKIELYPILDSGKTCEPPSEALFIPGC